MKPNVGRRLLALVVLAVVAGAFALPRINYEANVFGRPIELQLGIDRLNLSLFGLNIDRNLAFRRGLDIQGGMQVVLQADMSGLPESDRAIALGSVREVIARRVDLYGISEPVIQTAVKGDNDFRLIVELPGVVDPAQALELVGQTARLEFQLVEQSPTATLSASASAQVVLTSTGLDGSKLKRSQVQFDPQTGEPIVGMEFTTEGAALFAKITTDNTNKLLGIFLDDSLVMAPEIKTPILDGQAVISGGFTVDQAKQLSIQLNAGALPVPISVLEQRSIGASLGSESVKLSIQAGLIGLMCVALFMVAYYGLRGVIAVVALSLYAVLTLALYKLLGVTLTVPGIAGLILSIGMAVDANILIFERIKEEVRLGKTTAIAMELGFGRAWDSIKDANMVTIATSLILINPLNFSFLNSSGLVRGFGLTLLIGVLLGLFSGVVVTRTLMRIFIKANQT